MCFYSAIYSLKDFLRPEFIFLLQPLLSPPLSLSLLTLLVSAVLGGLVSSEARPALGFALSIAGESNVAAGKASLRA